MPYTEVPVLDQWVPNNYVPESVSDVLESYQRNGTLDTKMRKEPV